MIESGKVKFTYNFDIIVYMPTAKVARCAVVCPYNRANQLTSYDISFFLYIYNIREAQSYKTIILVECDA